MLNDKLKLNFMIIATTILVAIILWNNINTSLSTSLGEKENYERNKKYYEEVIAPAKLDLHPAKYYIKIDD